MIHLTVNFCSNDNMSVQFDAIVSLKHWYWPIMIKISGPYSANGSEKRKECLKLDNKGH